MLNIGDFLGRLGILAILIQPHIHFQVMNDKNLKHVRLLKIRFLNNLELIKGDVVCGLQGEVVKCLLKCSTL